MRTRPLLWFYLLAFAISWLGWAPAVAASRGVAFFEHPAFQILLLLPAVGPTIAAVVVTRATEGKEGVRSLMARLTRWRVSPLWYAVALLLPALVHLGAGAVDRVIGQPSSETRLVGPTLVSFVIISLLANPWEEVGWRGFALPRFQARSNALVATLAVGFLWGLWHIPLFLWAGGPTASSPFLASLIGMVAASFIYTWLYNATGGSLLIVALYHIAGNVTGAMLGPLTGSAVGGAIVGSLIAVLLVLAFGPQRLAR